MPISFYIDYDENPEIGGQQGVFLVKYHKPGRQTSVEGGHAHEMYDLIGRKIKSMETDSERRIIITVE